MEIKINQLPKQTQKEMHDMISENMSSLGFITVNTGKRMFVRFHPEHKRMVYTGWIVKTEVSADQHEKVCTCKIPGKTMLKKGRRTCSKCKLVTFI